MEKTVREKRKWHDYRIKLERRPGKKIRRKKTITSYQGFRNFNLKKNELKRI